MTAERKGEAAAGADMAQVAVEQLSEAQAKAELARLADVLARADRAYHADDGGGRI